MKNLAFGWINSVHVILKVNSLRHLDFHECQLRLDKGRKRVRELITHSQENPSQLFLDHSRFRKSQYGLEIATPVTRTLLLTWTTQAALHVFPFYMKTLTHHAWQHYPRNNWVPKNSLRGITLGIRSIWGLNPLPFILSWTGERKLSLENAVIDSPKHDHFHIRKIDILFSSLVTFLTYKTILVKIPRSLLELVVPRTGTLPIYCPGPAHSERRARQIPLCCPSFGC